MFVTCLTHLTAVICLPRLKAVISLTCLKAVVGLTCQKAVICITYLSTVCSNNSIHGDVSGLLEHIEKKHAF